MAKLIDTESLRKLAKDLDDRADAKVQAEEERASSAESALQESINEKQNKTDDSLATESKTIVGAINEIKENIEPLESISLNGHVLWIGTTTELEAIASRDPNTIYLEIDDGTKEEVVPVSVVDGVLSLTADKYQKTEMVSGTTIEFPAVTKFTEIHLYFEAEIDMELNFPDCKWRVEPNIEQGKSYEIVCIYNTIEWLVNVMVYS